MSSLGKCLLSSTHFLTGLHFLLKIDLSHFEIDHIFYINLNLMSRVRSKSLDAEIVNDIRKSE